MDRAPHANRPAGAALLLAGAAVLCGAAGAVGAALDDGGRPFLLAASVVLSLLALGLGLAGRRRAFAGAPGGWMSTAAIVVGASIPLIVLALVLLARAFPTTDVTVPGGAAGPGA